MLIRNLSSFKIATYLSRIYSVSSSVRVPDTGLPAHLVSLPTNADVLVHNKPVVLSASAQIPLYKMLGYTFPLISSYSKNPVLFSISFWATFSNSLAM